MIETIYSPDPNRYENGMHYNRCGKSGILLPAISLGLWHNFGAVNRLSDCIDIVHCAFDQGITHFDLANNYGPPYGSAEESFGQIMQHSLRPYRDELFVSTKAGFDMWPGPYGNWGSRKYLMASLDQSLKRMKLDYVDLFYSHRFDPKTPLEETLQALIDTVKQGKALYIGLSRWPKEATEFAIAYTRAQHVPCLIYQGRFNILDQAPKTEEILSCVQTHEIGFISYSPLAQGLLTDRYLCGIPEGSRMAQKHTLKPDMLQPTRLNRLNELAKQRGETLAEMALAWILHHKQVTSVLIGASSTEQLKHNLRCTRSAPFTQDELDSIQQIVDE